LNARLGRAFLWLHAICTFAVGRDVQTLALFLLRDAQADGEIDKFEGDEGHDPGPDEGGDHTRGLDQHLISNRITVGDFIGDIIVDSCAAE